MFPPERGHAASTAAVTDKAVYVLFGTGDLVCLDRAGKPLWARSLTKEYGVIRNDYGIASSPVVAGGLVLVQIDHLEGSYLLAADAATGKNRWKAERRGIYDNWATPVVATVGGEKQAICLGTKTITGYDLATGKQRWSLDGLEHLCSCTPIVRGHTLFAVSGPAGATLAVDLTASQPKVL
jgi:outer membrane protein assembly factor BamB